MISVAPTEENYALEEERICVVTYTTVDGNFGIMISV